MHSKHLREYFFSFSAAWLLCHLLSPCECICRCRQPRTTYILDVKECYAKCWRCFGRSCTSASSGCLGDLSCLRRCAKEAGIHGIQNWFKSDMCNLCPNDCQWYLVKEIIVGVGNNCSLVYPDCLPEVFHSTFVLFGLSRWFMFNDCGARGRTRDIDVSEKVECFGQLSIFIDLRISLKVLENAMAPWLTGCFIWAQRLQL